MSPFNKQIKPVNDLSEANIEDLREIKIRNLPKIAVK